MSNSSFTGVYNEESLNRIAASSADIGSLKAGSIVCDRIETSTPFDVTTHIISIFGSSGTSFNLTNLQISFAVATGHLYVYATHTTSAASINFGADTSLRAAELLSLFGLNDVVTSRLIKVTLLENSSTFTVEIKNSSGSTFKNVQFKEIVNNAGVLSSEVTATHIKTLIAASASRHAEGRILVQKITAATPGESAILFTIIEPCRAA